jgi:hypothetical protein
MLLKKKKCVKGKKCWQDEPTFRCHIAILKGFSYRKKLLKLYLSILVPTRPGPRQARLQILLDERGERS